VSAADARVRPLQWLFERQAWYHGTPAVRKHGLYAETRTFVANVQALKQRM
jgi:hypothetical protein